MSALSAYIQFFNDSTKAGIAKPKKFSKRETDPPLPQVLSIEEIAGIIQSLTGDVKTMVEVMVFAGLRRDEVFSMAVDGVDIESGIITVQGKGGKWRNVPVSFQPLLDKLKTLCEERKEGLLFVSPRTGRKWVDIRKPIAKAAEKAGIKNSHPPPVSPFVCNGSGKRQRGHKNNSGTIRPLRYQDNPDIHPYR